ncbi:MAG: hypothetical protein RMZ41_023400 [Nostoc sp. DedVER02]|uniref:hypothetical protein n=1 Tax=unclassified Nostoc TaxID=2593658 RepID=UPI002AD2DC13|nr:MULTISPECIES: hypothetical protein [unclassified Nostoc]MDZ7988158.1 hypothetical protein [Nostoc sp. DedVER02]MDZ8116180.1 hypothetical protein [Nostoc sp. DedVER01b]
MKTKFLVVIAATSAFVSALSSVIVAPANAQVAATNNVAVTLTVPEVLYLRTVSTIDLDLTTADLSSQTFTANGSGFYGSDKSGTANSTTSGLDTTSPFNNNGTNLTVTKTIPQVFAVWSNSPRGAGINVSVAPGTSSTLTGANSSTATLTNGAANPNFANVPGLVTPFIGGVDLSVDVGGNGIAQAGAYTGADINITATAN